MSYLHKFMNKPVKLIYKEHSIDSISKIAFGLVIEVNDKFLILEFLRDKLLKGIEVNLIETISELSSEQQYGK